MLYQLLESSIFRIFLNNKIRESINSKINIKELEPTEEGFYVVKHTFSKDTEIVFLCRFEIKNKRFSRLCIHEFLFFEFVEHYSFIKI